MKTEGIKTITKLFQGRIKLQEPLARYTSLKIGGPADMFFEANTKQELVDSFVAARKEGIPIYIIGGGTNILVSDKGFRGLVIRNMCRHITTKAIQGSVQNGYVSRRAYIEAETGTIFNTLVRYTIEDGLAGLEAHLGLPGSVGGAMYMNSKWTHPVSYVGDAVYQAEILTHSDNIRIVPKSYFHFGYDSSIIQKSKEVVLSVTFELSKGNKDSLWEIANSSIAYRQKTQPQGVLTAGCTFRNVPESLILSMGLPKEATSAGFLLDHAGMKGVTIGDARISTAHANFIINLGKARASDMIKLIDRAKEQVKKQFGISLEEEILRVGEQ